MKKIFSILKLRQFATLVLLCSLFAFAVTSLSAQTKYRGTWSGTAWTWDSYQYTPTAGWQTGVVLPAAFTASDTMIFNSAFSSTDLPATPNFSNLGVAIFNYAFTAAGDDYTFTVLDSLVFNNAIIFTGTGKLTLEAKNVVLTQALSVASLEIKTSGNSSSYLNLSATAGNIELTGTGSGTIANNSTITASGDIKIDQQLTFYHATDPTVGTLSTTLGGIFGAGEVAAQTLTLTIADGSEGSIGEIADSLSGGGTRVIYYKYFKTNTQDLTVTTHSGVNAANLGYGNILLDNSSSYSPLTVTSATTNGDRSSTDAAVIVLKTGADLTATNAIDALSVELTSGVAGVIPYILSTDINVETKTYYIKANTYNGDVIVNNSADTLIVFESNARQSGYVAMINANLDIVLADGAGTNTGTKEIKITNSGLILLAGSVTAPGLVTLTTSDDILAYLGSESINNTNILSQTVDLVADGKIGLPEFPIYLTNGSRIDANATKDVYLQGQTRLPIGIITTTGDIVSLTAKSGNANFIAPTSVVKATNKVALEVKDGNVLDMSNTGPISRIEADSLILIAKAGVGTTLANFITKINDYIGVTATDAGTSSLNKGVYINNTYATTHPLTGVNVTTHDYDVKILTNFGDLIFNTADDFLSNAIYPLNLNFTNTDGNIHINSINVGTADDVTLNATGNISQATGTITAKNISLIAGTHVGTTTAPIATVADSIYAVSGSAGIYVENTSADVALKASSTGTGAQINFNTSGNLSLNEVTSSGLIDLTVTGDITAQPLPVSVNNLTGIGLTLSAALVGTATNPILSQITGNFITTATGATFINNRGNITLNSTNTGGDYTFNNNGNILLRVLDAATFDALLTASGTILDDNDVPGTLNITANKLTLNGSSIGTSTDPIEIDVAEIIAASGVGTLNLDHIMATPILVTSITANGSVYFHASDTILLGTLIAPGQDVVLIAAGSIYDNRLAAETLPNVKAFSLDITGYNLGTEDKPLAIDVVVYSPHALGEMFAENASALMVSAGSLTGNTSATLSLTGSSIYIFDNHGGSTTVGGNGNLKLIAKNGNVVFLNPADEIVVADGKSITLQANACGALPSSPILETGLNGTVTAGNLTTGTGGSINISACNHIGINTLTAPDGKVTLASLNGHIVDQNGAALNIIADSVILSGKSVDALKAGDDVTLSNADVVARTQVLNAYNIAHDAILAQVALYESLLSQAQGELSASSGRLASLKAQLAILEAQQASLAASVLTQKAVVAGLKIGIGVACAIAGGAQAIPLVGDGGADAICESLNIGFDVADAVLLAREEALGDIDGEVSDKQHEVLAEEAVYSNWELAIAERSAILVVDRATESDYRTLIARADTSLKAAQKIYNLVYAVRNNLNVIGSPTQPLGIDATKNIDAVAIGQSNIFITAPNDFPAGHITAQGTTKPSRIVLAAETGVMTLSDAITSTGSVVLCAPTENITNHPLAVGSAKIVSDSLVAVALRRIGYEADQIATEVNHLAVNTSNQVIFIDNGLTTDLNVDNINVTTFCQSGNVVGVQKLGMGDTVSVTTLGDLVINAPVGDADGVVILNVGGTITGLATVSPQHIIAQKLFVTCEDGMGTLAIPITTAADTIQKIIVNNALTGVYINEVDDVTLGQITANAANVNLHSGGEFIPECGLSSLITAKKLTITAVNGIANHGACTVCTDNYIFSDIDTLYATTDNGDINIVHTSSIDLFVEKAKSGTGSVTILSNNGQIIANDIIAAENLVLLGTNIVALSPLTANFMFLTGSHGLGTEADPLDINTTRLQALANDDDIFINNLSPDLTIGVPTNTDCLISSYTGIGVLNVDANITLHTHGNLTIENLTSTIAADHIINLSAGGFITTNPVTGDLIETGRLNATAINSITIGGQMDSVNVLVLSIGDIEINNNNHGMVLVENTYTPQGTILINTGTSFIEVLAELNLTGNIRMIGNPYFKSHMNANRFSFDVTGDATFGNFAEWVASVEENNPLGRNFMSVSGDVILDPRFVIIADQYANKSYDIIKVGGTLTGNLAPTVNYPFVNPLPIVGDSISRDLIRVFGYNTYAFDASGENWIRIRSLHICDSVYDIDGNIYGSVGIGTKCWTTRNMTTTKYNDGRPAPSHIYFSETFNSDSLSNLAIYGRLYNWATALDNATDFTNDVQGICPGGWRVPNMTDFSELITYGADSLRSVDYWLLGGNDYYGFSALPAGYYNYIADNSYYLSGDAYFWIAAPNTTSLGKACHLFFGCPEAFIIDFAKEDGASVRCVKVDPLSFP